MYEAYWKFTHKPFGYRVRTPDLYRSRAVQAAALRLRYCFENNAGAAMLLGGSGVGKSSLLQLLRDEGTHLRPFIHLSYPRLSSGELSRTIACALLECDSVSDLTADALLVRQHACLKKHADNGVHPVVVLDEAHLMSNDTLNDVVLPLLNLAETDFSVRLTVVLAGQPSLGARISRNAQLRDRIAVTATMSGLSANETADYIRSGIVQAGGEESVFAEDALAAVMELSAGNPRLVNRLCDMALLVGYSDQSERITAADVSSLAAEILPAAA